MFSEFGFVLAFAVTLSSITALTLAPVLAALLDPGNSRITKEAQPSPFARAFDWVMDFAIRTPLLVQSVAVGFAMIAAGAAMTLPSTVTPDEDRGFFIVQARGASDTTVDYLDTQVVMIERILSRYQENGQIETVQSIIGIGGGTTAKTIVRLPDWAGRDNTQQ